MAQTKHAIVVGSGPNGLAAAIALAQAGVRVTVFEAAATPGGCLRSESLTLPGFLHDAGAAVFPLAIASPFLRTLPLHRYGLTWVEPDIPVAHPLDGDAAVALHHSLQATADALGVDGAMWRKLLYPILHGWPRLLDDALAPPLHLPRYPWAMAKFASRALSSATDIARILHTSQARALFAGLAAHASVPLHFPATAGEAIILAAAAHTSGWPIAMGGSQSVAHAMCACLRALGGEVVLNHHVGSLCDLPKCDALLLDVTPRQFTAMASASLSPAEARIISDVQPGPGVFKVDWALSTPIPWSAEAPRRAGTVHLGGTWDEIASSESDVWDGVSSAQPYVLLSQPSLFDSTRAPAGQHTAWAYCHVPHGSTEDFTERVENQVERFAPGFRKTILARHTRTAAQMEQWNPNLIGGDLSGGAMTLKQILLRTHYRTPMRGVYLCSSSTAPGGGVHGMCGWNAAALAARDLRLPRLRLP